MQPFVNWCYWIFIARTWNNVPPKWLSRRLVDCLLILLNARAYLNIAIESRFAPMMLLAVFKKVQYKLLMHRLAQMNVRFALMNSKRCTNFPFIRLVQCCCSGEKNKGTQVRFHDVKFLITADQFHGVKIFTLNFTEWKFTPISFLHYRVS